MIKNLKGAVRYRIVVFLLLASIFLYETVSGPLLTVLHIPYDAPTGNFLFKLHVATYLLFLAFAIFIFKDISPLGNLIQSLGAQKRLSFYLIVTLFLLLYSALRYGLSGSAFILETLSAPAIFSLLLLQLQQGTKRAVIILIILLITLNALIGIFESITHFRLIPYTVNGGVPINEDTFRSTALLGHPLTNALITGPIIIVIAGLKIRSSLRIALLIVLWIGLLSFGGRTSFVVTTFILLLYMVLVVPKNLIQGRYSYLQVTGSLIAATLILGVLMSIMIFTSLGERIFANLFWDSSASVRVGIWRVFDYITAEELIFGLSPTSIEVLIYRLSMQYPLAAIENFWLLMLLQMGIVGFIPFAGGIASVIFLFWSQKNLALRLSILAFFLIASSNNSLASKTPALTILFAVWTCTMSLFSLQTKRERMLAVNSAA